jgi:hypothetical protein
MRFWGKLVQVNWTQDFVSKTASDEALEIYLNGSNPPVLNYDSVAKAQDHIYQSI